MLDTDLWFVIMDQLPIKDIFTISRTCRFMHNVVQSYKSVAFSFASVLKPFVEHEDLTSLQQMMFQTTAIISGSTALQFFARTRYDNSDLDIYIPEGSLEKGADWLLAHGYESEKRIPAPEDPKDPFPTLEGYDCTDEIVGVYNFKKGNPSKVVQLIATRREPIYAILDFHSTCVLNFITHDQAYSLYPFTTLCKQETVVLCELWRGHNEDSLHKYEQRGWKACKMDDICERDDTNDDRYVNVKGPSELAAEERRIGDVYCWILELDQTPVHASVYEEDIKWNVCFAGGRTRLELKVHSLSLRPDPFQAFVGMMSVDDIFYDYGEDSDHASDYGYDYELY
ncbi:hypothetical protein AX14_013794 [Amanita brunnescens Koide BX004]|nr:hypothetical protein AX14_013794 [Amanita brunnescens Koide BX004]